MNLTGVLLGMYMLVVIGFGFFWVIRLEYHLGAGIWKAVLAVGVLVVIGSLFLPNFTLSALVGIFGGSIVWGATELPDQEERVRRGMFPANPKRRKEQGEN